MEKFIQVYDNIIPSGLINLTEEKILKQGDYGDMVFNFFNSFYPFHPNHAPSRKESGFGFGNDFFNTKNSLKSPNLLFFTQPLYYTSFSLNFIIEQLLTARIWLLTPEKENFICGAHVDLDTPHLVGLYYVNDSDGDTIFFDNDKTTIIKKVSPKKGRMVIFDGSIYHASSTPTKDVRCVINYNFIITK